jgi:hypothetical protein
MNTGQNFNFNTSELISYIVIKYKRRADNIILEALYISAYKIYCLMRFSHVKTKNIIYFPYKKSRTKFPSFSQNHPYSNFVTFLMFVD